MRRHLSYIWSAKKWYRKNDERQNKACQRGKKRQRKSLLLVRLSKKRLGEMGLSEMKLGEMRLGEMLPNHIILSSSSSRFILPSSLNVCIRYLKILSAGLIKFR